MDFLFVNPEGFHPAVILLAAQQLHSSEVRSAPLPSERLHAETARDSGTGFSPVHSKAVVKGTDPDAGRTWPLGTSASETLARQRARLWRYLCDLKQAGSAISWPESLDDSPLTLVPTGHDFSSEVRRHRSPALRQGQAAPAANSTVKILHARVQLGYWLELDSPALSEARKHHTA